MPDDTGAGGATGTSGATTGDQGATPPGTDTTGGAQPGDLRDEGKRAIDAMKAARNAAIVEAKTLKAQLEELQRSQMSDHEKAIDEAKAAARAEALAEAGAHVARAEIRAAAATAGLSDDQCKTLLGGIDPKAFLTEAGEVDAEKVKSFIAGVAPTRQKLDLGQGTRGSAAGATDMNSAIRRAAGRGAT